MANSPAPIFASDATAAKLMDMRPAEFLALVARGDIPPGREIAPGIIRWDVESLRSLARGDAVDGGIQW